MIFCKLGDTVDAFGALRGGQRDQNCKMHYLMLPRDYVIREYLKEHHGGAQKASAAGEDTDIPQRADADGRARRRRGGMKKIILRSEGAG